MPLSDDRLAEIRQVAQVFSAGLIRELLAAYDEQRAEVERLRTVVGMQAVAVEQVTADRTALRAEVERLRAQAADAWDDGYNSGHADALAVQPTYPDPTRNPHRAALASADEGQEVPS